MVMCRYKDGKVVQKDSERVKMYNEEGGSYELIIEKALLEDAGSYSVVASNELSQSSEFCKVTFSSQYILKNISLHV